MSSPITFSGFNDIDFNLVVNSLMQQASVPLTSLQTQQKALQSRANSMDKLSGLVSTLRSAADALGAPASLAMLGVTSGNSSAVAASVSASATPGSYDVIVNELAKAQVTVSSSSTPDSNMTAVATGGSLTIGGVTVTVAGSVTLQQLASAINGTAGIGVTASVIRTGASSYKLALSSLQTGAANAFTITNGLTGGTGVAFTDTDNDNISGNSAADNAVNATDASLLINNIPVTGASNTFTDVMPGLTLTAIKKDPAATVHVEVATDSTALKAQMQTFVTAYNDFIKFIGEQRTSAANGDATSIGRDPVVRSLQSSLRSALSGVHGAGALTRLAEAGIEATSTGQLKLNETVFNAAVASNPQNVRDLFGGSGAAFTGIETLLDGYQDTDGFIPAGKRRLEQQISSMDQQIQNMQARLAIQRQALQKQFAEADAMMSRLKSQAGSLASFGSSLGS